MNRGSAHSMSGRVIRLRYLQLYFPFPTSLASPAVASAVRLSLYQFPIYTYMYISLRSTQLLSRAATRSLYIYQQDSFEIQQALRIRENVNENIIVDEFKRFRRPLCVIYITI